MVVESVEPGCLFTKFFLGYRNMEKRQKQTKTRIFFTEKLNLVPNNCYLMSHFKPPNIDRKNCVWTTKYRRLSKMCIVQHAGMKSVFTIEPIKRLISTTLKIAKPAATFWTFLSRTETDNSVVWR